jgi:hypothetical protein
MQKKLYIIEYEGAHWCGGVSHCLVYAENGDQAQELADYFMDESMRELFGTEYEEDRADGGDLDSECAYVMNWCRELTEDDEFYQWVQDPDQQAAFYPYINKP